MTITPDQARELRGDVESHGYAFPFQFQPWGDQNQNGDCAESILMDAHGETIVYGLPDSVGELLVSAPDLAQTIAGMEYEHTFQTRPRRSPWREWITQEDWFDTRDAAYRAAMNIQDAGSFNCRLVRRLIGPVEVEEL